MHSLISALFFWTIVLAIFNTVKPLEEEEFFQEIGFDIQLFPYREHWDSPSFDLWVSMDDTQSRLSILLKNYVDGFVYHRFFSEEELANELGSPFTVNIVFRALT